MGAGDNGKVSTGALRNFGVLYTVVNNRLNNKDRNDYSVLRAINGYTRTLELLRAAMSETCESK